MDANLIRAAADAMGMNHLGPDYMLSRMVLWCGENSSDFRLRHETQWQATVWLSGHDAIEGVADNPHDALARLIIDFCKWRDNQSAAPTE